MVETLLLIVGMVIEALIFTGFGYMYGKMRGVEAMLDQRAEWIKEAEARDLIEWYTDEDGCRSWRWKGAWLIGSKSD